MFLHVPVVCSFLTGFLNNHCKFSEHLVWHIRSPCQIRGLPLTSPNHPKRGRTFGGSQIENQVNSPGFSLVFVGLTLESIILSSLKRTATYLILYPQLKIPVSGSRSAGHLYVTSSRDAPFHRYYGKMGGYGGTEEPSDGNNPDSHFHF